MTAWRRALVTGASSGIGRAFARRLAADGTDIVLVARDGDRLRRLAAELRPAGPGTSGVEVEVLVADLGDPDRLEAVAERLASPDEEVDLCVNNAGFGFAGEVVDLDPGAEAAVVDVNVRALHRLSIVAAATMVERGRGGILNVSSVAGHGPAPRAATYAATKAFVTSFSLALSAELRPRGVAVTCLCPGLTRTEFQQRAGSRPPRVPGFAWQSAEEVAAAGLDGIARGRPLVIPAAHNRATATAIRLAPLGLIDRVRRVTGG